MQNKSFKSAEKLEKNTPKKKLSKEEMEDEREFKLSAADQQELVKISSRMQWKCGIFST